MAAPQRRPGGFTGLRRSGIRGHSELMASTNPTPATRPVTTLSPWRPHAIRAAMVVVTIGGYLLALAQDLTR
jgi:hypothetical protein